MTCVWINPVAECMTEPAVLADMLERHHMERIVCRINWGRIVRDKYTKLVGRTMTLADARCPMAVALVQSLKRELGKATDGLVIADIEPILIHSARELAARADLSGRKKLITTPCRALAEQGNRLNLPETRFLTWLDFLKELGEHPAAPPEESPIPPGFFDGTGIKTASMTGCGKITSYIESGAWRSVSLLELLYCPGGCHNGDGVKSDGIDAETAGKAERCMPEKGNVQKNADRER